MRKFKAIPGKGIVAATEAESKTDLTHALDNIDKSDYVGDEDGDPILYSGLKWVGGVGVIDADGGKFRLMHFFGDPTHQTDVEYLENDYKTEEAAKKAGRDYLKKIAKNKEAVESAKKIKAGCHGKKQAVKAADDEQLEGERAATSNTRPKDEIDEPFYAEFSSDDPADWSIDYDGFFEELDELIYDLGYGISEDSERQETWGGEYEILKITDDDDNIIGEVDTYEIETNLLNDLYDEKLAQDADSIREYLKNEIQSQLS